MFLFKFILTIFGCWALMKATKIAGAWIKYWFDGLDPETMHERRKYRQWLDDD